MSGSTCSPKIAVTFFKTPSYKIFFVPKPPSSAGWKTRSTVPYSNNKIINVYKSSKGSNFLRDGKLLRE